MKRLLSSLIIAATGISPVMAGVDYTLNEHGALIKSSNTDVSVEWYTPSVVRVQRYPASTHPDKQSLSVIEIGRASCRERV